MHHPRQKALNAPPPKPERPKQAGTVVQRTNPRHLPFVGKRQSQRAAARAFARPMPRATHPETPRFGRAGRGQLPTLEQYVARGYSAEHYAEAMENYRKDLRAQGVTPIEPEPTKPQ